MSAGRPYNSMTPVWRSKPAAKVRAYRFLMGAKGTKAECARNTGLSRSTVIKWWNQVEWTPENSQTFNDIQNWMGMTTHYKNFNSIRCASEMGIPVDIVEFELITLDEIFRLGKEWSRRNGKRGIW